MKNSFTLPEIEKAIDNVIDRSPSVQTFIKLFLHNLSLDLVGKGEGEKRYRLLKDLPDAKAGEIYKKQSGHPNWYITDGNSTFHATTIEDSPEWFELMSESTYNPISLFEKGVRDAIEFRRTHPNPRPRFKAPDPIPERDWEILSVENEINGIWVFDSTPFDKVIKSRIEQGRKTNWRIHSVRRISDSTVFSIGDECIPNGHKIYAGKITKFAIENNTMDVWLKSDTGIEGRETGIGKFPRIEKVPNEKTNVQEQPKKEDRIVVDFLSGYIPRRGNLNKFYEFRSSKEIDLVKYKSKIQQAIEAVINDAK